MKRQNKSMTVEITKLKMIFVNLHKWKRKENVATGECSVSGLPNGIK